MSVHIRKALHVGCAALLAAGVMLVGSPAQAGVLTVADPSSATVTGHITLSDGSPAIQVRVQLWPMAGGIFPEATTDADGGYSFPPLTPGNYKLLFRLGAGPQFYAPGTVDFSQAQIFTFNAGQVVAVDEQIPATGRLVGHFTDNGQPVAGVSVNGSSVGAIGSFDTTTGPDGSFSVQFLPGAFRVSFRLPNGLMQYAHEKTHYSEADPVVITAGADTTLEEHLVPTGSIGGHLSNSDGTPAADVSVNVNGPDGEYYYATTDATGAYSVTAFPGRYGLSFSGSNELLRYHATLDPAQAGLVTVTAGQITTVDESFLPTGSLTVTARDAKTHAAVNSFCVYVDGVQASGCTETGTVTFDAVGPGTRNVSFYGDENYANSQLNHVAVTSGHNSAAVVDVTPYSKLKTVIRDAVTGLPVANACLDVITDGTINGIGHGGAGCSDANGNVETNVVGSGIFKAFVWARDGVHGDQWVGLNGGVGTTLRARPIVIRAGETTTIAPVKLDKAATLTGVITDKATGAPVQWAAVGIIAADTGAGDFSGSVFTDEMGHYTISELGPYDWPILVNVLGYESVWSGRTGNRLLADGVHLKAGQTATYNVALGKGTTLTGLVSNRWGPLSGVRIIVMNAVTGDNLATADSGPDGRYTVQVFGPQAIKLFYLGYNYGVGLRGWVGGKDQAHSTTFVVTGSGSKTANVAATEAETY